MATEKREQQIADMSEDQLLHLNQKCMRDLETIWKVAAQRLDERAGSDRIGHNAVSSACFLGIHFKLKALHCEMDALAAQAGDVPVARSGER